MNFSLEKIKSNLIKIFNSRIVCFLYYGSNAYNKNVSSNSDYDFCLVLDKRNGNDLLDLRKIFKYDNIEISVHYMDEINTFGWNNFHSDNHGVFYALHYASITPLIGKNIFLIHKDKINELKIKESLKNQIIEYFWRLNKIIITKSEVEINYSYFKKYVIRIAQDIMLINKKITYEDVNLLNYNDCFNKYILLNFSKKTSMYIKLLLDDLIDFNQLIVLINLLYSEFLIEFN